MLYGVYLKLPQNCSQKLQSFWHIPSGAKFTRSYYLVYETFLSHVPSSDHNPLHVHVKKGTAHNLYNTHYQLSLLYNYVMQVIIQSSLGGKFSINFIGLTSMKAGFSQHLI